MSVDVARESLELPDRTVQLERGGEGPAVLYLHSAMGDGYWNELAEALAGHGFHVLCPAHPGYWDSTRPDWIRSPADLALHYVDVLDALGLERTLVVGASLGGWIATELAILRPQRVERLVLVGPLGLRGASDTDLFALQPFEAAERLFADPSTPAARMLAAIDLDDPPDEELILPLLQTFEASARYAWWPFDPTLERRLRFAASVPALVLRGSEDGFMDPRVDEIYADEMGATLDDVPGAGHLAALERPAQTAALVAGFLQGRSG